MKLLVLLLLVGCGLSTTNIREVDVARSFEGRHVLDNYSFIEILASEDGDVTIITKDQILQSINPKNGTFANHPRINKVDLSPIGNLLFFSQDVNYNSTRDDVETDVAGSNIDGRRKTDFLLEVIPQGIRLTISIYNAATNQNTNNVVVKRVWESK